MHEKHSEGDGSAISVCAVNYDSMVIFSLSSLNYAVCFGGFGRCLRVLALACTPVTDYVSA